MATTPNTDSNYFSPRTKHLAKNYALAGAAAGGGAALATALANYLGYLKDKADRKKDTSYNDSVMYVDVPLDKRASISGGIGMAAGGVSAIGTYMIGRKIYQKLKKKMLQKDLDETQQSYYDKIVNPDNAEEIEKKAADLGRKPMSTAELVASSPISFTLLTALASGIVANKALGHYFPGKEKLKPDNKPKSIRVRYTRDGKPVGEEDPIELGQTKVASTEVDFIISAEDRKQSTLFLCDIAMEMSKSSSYLADLVGATVSGRIEEIESNFLEYGPTVSLELIKGAGDISMTPSAKKMAIALLVNSDVLGPTSELLAATDVMDYTPSFCKIAAELPQTDANSLVKIAAALGVSEVNQAMDSAMAGADQGPEKDKDVHEGMSPRQIMELLIGREMQKTDSDEKDKLDKKDKSEDPIDKMLS